MALGANLGFGRHLGFRRQFGLWRTILVILGFGGQFWVLGALGANFGFWEANFGLWGPILALEASFVLWKPIFGFGSKFWALGGDLGFGLPGPGKTQRFKKLEHLASRFGLIYLNSVCQLFRQISWKIQTDTTYNFYLFCLEG